MAATGSFTATGTSDGMAARGFFRFRLYGDGVGTVKLEKSYNGGTTWTDVNLDDYKTVASWAKLTGDEISPRDPFLEIGVGALYRLNCTAHSSGTISYDMEATG